MDHAMPASLQKMNKVYHCIKLHGLKVQVQVMVSDTTSLMVDKYFVLIKKV